MEEESHNEADKPQKCKIMKKLLNLARDGTTLKNNVGSSTN
jgi:hypothetical protein